MKGQTRTEARRAWLWAAGIVLVLSVLGALIWRGSTGSLWETRSALPAETSQVLTASEGLDEITIDAVFNPEARTLSATQVLTVRNRWDETLTSCVLRSWTGAFLKEDTLPLSEAYQQICYPDGFNAGGLTLKNARVNGADCAFTWLDAASTALSLPVSAGWKPGETLRVELEYIVDIPACASRFGESGGLWSLCGVFPMLALREDGAWRLDDYAQVGDPFVSECANWTVRLTTPAGYQAAASCWAEPKVLDEATIYTWRGLCLRDFGLMLSQDYVLAQGVQGDTLVSAFAATQALAKDALKYAKQAIETFGKHYGACDWNALTVAEIDFPYGGMEYPQLVVVSRDTFDLGGWALERTVVHETAHQWWYAAVGSDSVNDAWQDESLCEYSVLTYIADRYGEDVREEQRIATVEQAMRQQIKTDITPGSPLSYFTDMAEYGTVVYSRGAALWVALEELLTRDGVDAFLKAYHAQGRFRIVTRTELEALLRETTGQDLSALFSDYLDTRLVNY